MRRTVPNFSRDPINRVVFGLTVLAGVLMAANGSGEFLLVVLVGSTLLASEAYDRPINPRRGSPR